jgi:rubrerythrin
MVHHNLTILEAVALAVRSEIDSNDLYQRLAERVKNPDVKEILKELADDEEQHRASLMRLYEDMLGSQDPSIPQKDGRTKQIVLDDNADYRAVVTAARDKELGSEAAYKEAAEQVRDYKTREFFRDLAETERRHAAVLQKQVDKLEEDPDWFDRENADPFKPVHVGP